MQKHLTLLAALMALAFVACDSEPSLDGGGADASSADAGSSDAGTDDDAGPTDAGLTDAGPDDAGPGDAGPTDGGPGDAGPADGGPTDGGADAGPPSGLVDVTIRGSVLLGNNYPQQIHPLFRASFAAGSGMGRLQLFARFCSDAACNDPIAVVPAEVAGAGSDGLYVFSTASVSGGGFAKDFVIPQAPAGSSFMQLVGDTQRSRLWDRGTCSTVADCPADADVIQMDGFQIEPNVAGGDFNPNASSTPVSVTAGGTVDLTDVIYLGHVVFDLATVAGDPAPEDRGTLLAAMSNSDSSYRNYMALIDLDDASATPGATTGASYILQEGSGDYAGDVCGVVQADDALYAIAVNISGAAVFELNLDGTQRSTTPVVRVPPSTEGDPTTLPYPCRGVWQRSSNGNRHLYLIHYKGAGSEDQSLPHPLVHVDITAGTYETPYDALGDHALRALVPRGDGASLVAVDMSWSKYSNDNSIGVNRLLPIEVNAVTGALGPLGTAVETRTTADASCGSTASYPSGAALVDVSGELQIFVGSDTGVTAHKASDLTESYALDLQSHGQLFTQFTASRDGRLMYALPVCKTVGARSRFELPAGAGTENSDTNLVAVLDLTGVRADVATTTLDIDGNGTPDDGVDMDYYRIKAYIRDFSSTLPIPPVVYVGPQMALGESMLFVRGSGIQGAGFAANGLGQVQDIGFFNLGTGQGAVFDDYMPWFDGLSAGGGTGAGIWGYDVWADRESSVGALVYIPAP